MSDPEEQVHYAARGLQNVEPDYQSDIHTSVKRSESRGEPNKKQRAGQTKSLSFFFGCNVDRATMSIVAVLLRLINVVNVASAAAEK
jgi:hypothetical protein